MMYASLVTNVALLVTLAAAYDLVRRRWDANRSSVKVLMGTIFGVLGIAVMTSSWGYAPGITFDVRSILLGVGGVFLGGVPTIIAMAITSLFRLLSGETAAWPEITLIWTSGGLGIAWRRLRRERGLPSGVGELFAFGVLVHVGTLLGMLHLSRPLALEAVTTTSVYAILLCPLGTVLLGKLMADQSARREREASVAQSGVGILRTGSDVTSHGHAEEALVASEARYRRTLDDMLEGCQVIGRDWRYLYVNDAVAKQGRRSREELLGRTMMEAYPGIENTDLFAVLRRCMEKRIPHRMENEFVFPDGSAGWFELSVQPVPDGIFILTIDTTERKRIEQALRDEKVFIDNALNTLPDVFYVFDLSGKLLRWNARLREVSGYSDDDIARMHPRDFFPSDEVQRIEDSIQRALQGGYVRIEAEFMTNTGQRIPYEFSGSSLKDSQGALIGICGNGRDVTRRKQAEKDLKASETRHRESEEKYRAIVEGALDGITTSDKSGGILTSNDAYCRMIGYTEEELQGMTWADVEVTETSVEVSDHIEAIRIAGMDRFETKQRRKDGRVIDVEVSVRVFNAAEGVFVNFIRDITDRTEAAAEIESLARFPAENPNPVLRVASTGTILYANEAGSDLLSLWGCWRGGVLPEDWRGVVSDTLSTGVLQRHEVMCGSKVYMLTLASVENAGFVNVYGLDITDRKRAEEELCRKERMVSSSQDIMALMGPDYVYLAANDAHLRALGKAKDEVVGRPVAEVLGQELFESVIKPRAQACLEGERVRYREWLDFPTLGRRHMDVAYSPYINDNGEIVGVVVCARDVTEQKKVEQALRESEARLRLKLDTILLPETDIADQELANFLEIPTLQSLLEDFTAVTGMATAVLDLKGNVLVATGWQDICTKFHRAHPETAKNCIESDLYLSKHVQPGEYVSYKCKNQLWDMVTPLIIGDKHIANVYTGQFFLDDETVDVDAFIAQAARYGFDQKAYLAAMERVPRISRERATQVMKYLTSFTVFVSRLTYSNIKLARAMCEQQRTEEELRKSQALLVEAQGIAHVGNWEWDVRTGEVQWSDEVYHIFGLDPESFHPQIDSILALSPPEERDRGKELIEKAVNSREMGSYEQRFYRSDGSMGTYISTFAGRYDNEGNLIRVVGVAHDISERKRAETALKQSEERFDLAMRGANDGLWDFDAESGEVYYSPRWKSMLGYAEDEIDNRRDEWYRLLHPEDRDGAVDHLNAFLEGRIPSYETEFRMLHKSGCPVFILSRAHAVRDETGKVTRLVGTHMDVTEHKQAEEKLQRSNQRLSMLHDIDKSILRARSTEEIARMTLSRLRQIIPCSRGSVFLYDPSAQVFILHANDVGPGIQPDIAGRFSSAQWESFGHLKVGQPVLLADREAVDHDSLSATASTPFQGMGSCILAPLLAQEELIGLLSLSYVEDGFFTNEHKDIVVEIAGLLAISLHQSRLRNQIQRHAATLERQVEERTNELRDKNAELESFAHSVSHDLRAPLRAMEGFAEAIIEDYAPRLDDEGREYLRHIVDSATRMDVLITDLLAYSRIGRTELRIQPVPLDAVVKRALGHLQAEIQAKDAQVSVADALPEVRGHPSTLLQVVSNLVSNGLKFVSPGVQPQIRIWAEKINGMIRLWIEDNGIGIAEEHQERVFRVFERLHGIETYPGTGIGLAIVQRATERLGGRCGVESAPGTGSRFWVEYPEISEEEKRE